MLGGLQLITLGVLGKYLWRLCDEVRKQPLFLVQEAIGSFPRIERELKSSCIGRTLHRIIVDDDDRRARR